MIESHARHCPDCGRLLAAARRERADWWEGTGHPPVSLLATEPLDERVRLHVSGCAECRDEVALLSGAVVIEKVFGRPGLGSTLLDAIAERNYPVVQGCVLVIAVIYVVVNILVDLAYGLADPRIRRAG